MNIITVIPLSRSKMVNELTYFTASEVPKGALVTVPLRSKQVHAIVTNVQPVADLKSNLKSAAFALKKLGKVKATAFFPASFMDNAKKLANFYASETSLIIEKLVLKTILENAENIVAPKVGTHEGSMREIFAVQGDDDDRISSWRSLIRQEFARKKSIAIYVPTIEDVRNMSSKLEKGIEGYIFTLHGGLNEKKIISTWQDIANTNHSVVVIATGSFALLPRGDIETVIIERENSRGWISQRAPYMDLRHALETISNTNKQTVYLADNLLRVETLRRLDNHEIAEGTPLKWRSITTAKETLVDMRKKEAGSVKPEENNPEVPIPESQIPTFNSKVSFRVLSPELEELIRKNLEDNTHLFIYTVRRGMSPLTVCADCETIVSCAQCSAPVVLHTSKQNGKNFFMCHTCGERRSAVETCINCNSWRLTPLGIGIDRVVEEIAKAFPLVDIFKIDSDTTKTEKQIHSVISKFKSKPGSVLIGTDMALLHIPEKVEHVAVASIDSLFSLPDFRIQEKVMYTLIRLRAIADRTFLVQTRRPEEKIFEYGMKGNLSDFYRTTLDERMQFSYPPYSLLIKLTIEGKKDMIANDMAACVKVLEPQEVDIFPAFTSTVRGNSVIHGLMKIPPRSWPDAQIIEKLRALPPSVSIKVNPESLL